MIKVTYDKKEPKFFYNAKYQITFKTEKEFQTWSNKVNPYVWNISYI